MIFEILKYTLPALIVLLGTFLVLNSEHSSEHRRRLLEQRSQDRKTTLPLQLRGYERLTIFLERITPEHLLLDRDLSVLTPTELQRQLLLTIRMEFDHNAAQQLYVSDEAWAKVVNAKEEMMRYVNTLMSRLPKDATTLQMAQALIETYHLNGETPVQIALKQLRFEVHEIEG
ncbi:MAG: hypothetical protein IJ756_08965 [Paludibacteraceae bacterium]|nr:hypothetical protein [Paludibacteraceae bacterium]